MSLFTSKSNIVITGIVMLMACTSISQTAEEITIKAKEGILAQDANVFGSYFGDALSFHAPEGRFSITANQVVKKVKTFFKANPLKEISDEQFDNDTYGIWKYDTVSGESFTIAIFILKYHGELRVMKVEITKLN